MVFIEEAGRRQTCICRRHVAGRLRVLLTPRNARHAPRNAGWAWSQASTTSIAAATRDPTKFANAWLARAQPASTLTTGAATSARRNRRKRAASSPSAHRATPARGRAPAPPAPPAGLGLAPCVPMSACTRGYGAYGASAALSPSSRVKGATSPGAATPGLTGLAVLSCKTHENKVSANQDLAPGRHQDFVSLRAETPAPR